MAELKKQTLMQGAFTLLVANLIVKILGSLLKIPLFNILGEEGMGWYNSAYTIYTFMFVVATAGFPVAISKMVAQRVTLGKRREAERVFICAVAMLSVIGLAGTLALRFGDSFFARLMANETAHFAILAISPAVFCISLSSAFRGYFQGYQNMYPTAFSEVVESAGKLVIGFFLAFYLLPQGIQKAAGGAVFGVTCGAFLSFLLLILIYFRHKRKQPLSTKESTASYRSIAKELLVIALPITIGASVASLTNVIDSMTLMRRLQTIAQVTPEFQLKYAPLIAQLKQFTGGINEELANKIYGLYTGCAVPLFNMPLTLVTALSVSVVPSIASSLAKRDDAAARQSTESVIKITLLLALPCAIGMSLLAEPILLLLFPNALVPATTLLQKLSIAIIFVSLLSVTSAILQAYGHTVLPMVNMLIGGIIKVAINYTLVANPAIHIEGAPIGTIVCYFVIAIMNLAWIAHFTGARYRVLDFFIKPLLATALMGGAVLFAYRLFLPMAGPRLVAFPAILVGVLVYGVSALLVRALNKEDVNMLPMGTKLASLMERYHLL